MKVGQLLRQNWRYHNDIEYRKKNQKRKKEYAKNNKEIYRNSSEKYTMALNIFKNKHCKICNKLLNFRTKGKYCFKHQWSK